MLRLDDFQNDDEIMHRINHQYTHARIDGCSIWGLRHVVFVVIRHTKGERDRARLACGLAGATRGFFRIS